jgi:pimeloyl-ACP methyl ester carboxylesterase
MLGDSAVDPVGSRSIQIGQTTTFQLSASKAGITVRASTTVRVDPLLTADISGGPTIGTAPFTGTYRCIANGGAPPYIFTWSTGEGGEMITHVWRTVGQFSLTCTVLDSQNRVISASRSVTVRAPDVQATFALWQQLGGSDPNRSGCGPGLVTDAATDGVTRIELCLLSSAPGTVTFSFDRSSGSFGGIVAFPGDSGPLSSRLMVATSRDGTSNRARATYLVPIDFPTGGDPKLHFTAQFQSSSGTTLERQDVLNLIPPPVILIHGIFSGPDRWAFRLIRDSQKKSQYHVWPMFWTGRSSLSETKLLVVGSVKDQLTKLRSENGIAATRVDVVGHSMGGLLARAWANAPYYLRQENYYKGDFHKIITFNTPHYGSPLGTAGFAVESALKAFDLWSWTNLGGDLRQESASRIAQISNTNVPAHSIAGEPIATGITSSRCTSLPGALIESVMQLAGPLEFLDPWGRLFGERSDEVVGVSSQQGGLREPATELMPRNCRTAHTEVIRNDDYSARVESLLNEPVASASFAYFPAPLRKTTPLVTSTSRLRSRLATGDELAIASPKQNEKLLSGALVSASLAASAAVTEVTLFGPHGAVKSSTLPFNLEFMVPPEYLGTYPIVAVGKLTSGDVIVSETIAPIVTTAAALESLTSSAPKLYLDENSTYFWPVQGTFSDGYVRNMTQSGRLTYSTTDPSVADIDADGTIHARNAGQAQITARESSLTTSVDVIVSHVPSQRGRAVRH